MSTKWADRQRRTNRLVRKIAGYIFDQDEVTPLQIYGLTKLSWITKSYDGENASYIKSTKIPALGNIFNRDYDKLSLEEVSLDVARITKDETIASLINEHTGFNNFYGAYRNSSKDWVHENFKNLLPMYKSAYAAKSNADRELLIKGIMKTPGIPKVESGDQLMGAEQFLTPAFFMLDNKIKFPLINGKNGVKKLLKALRVNDDSLLEQYRAMVGLYGKSGVDDAADVDQIDDDLSDLIDNISTKAKKSLLKNKETNDENYLPLKDEGDVDVIAKAGTVSQRRIHNQLTNMIKESLSQYTLLEGSDKSCMFDVLVKKYDKKQDLLIEVKSSLERPNIRMAIGQLFDYRYSQKNKDIGMPHTAILLPGAPDYECVQFVESLDIGLLWFEADQICTSTEWLMHLAIKSN
jgi:hypothetical protein